MEILKLLGKGIKVKIAVVGTIILLILAIIGYLYIQYMIVNNTYMKMITAVNTSLGFFDEEEQDEIRKGRERNFGDFYEGDQQTVFGAYPVDPELRIRQEMLEICEKVGKAYGLPPKLVLAVAMTEAFGSVTGTSKVEIVNGQMGSLYTHLSLDNITGYGGRSFFIDAGNTGKYKDKDGNEIKELYKIGEIDTSVKGAVGMFQFEASYIKGNFQTMYVEQNGVVEPQVGVYIMSVFDKDRGFLRPNPLFFPDQAVNAANKIASLMRSHEGQLRDIRVSIPNEVGQEILFIYAADAYRGDMNAPGKKGKDMHDAMGNLFADVYSKYSKQTPNINSLGDFSKKEFNKSGIRTLVAGRQNGYDFTGTMPSGGVTIEENNYTRTFLEEFSNTSPHNINYLYYFNKINNNGANMNKFGLVHGFEGINAATYYWDHWNKLIEAAEKEQGGIGAGQGAGGDFIWPLTGYTTITSEFGMRIHPILRTKRMHTGIDISAPGGVEIKAAQSGNVIFSGWNGANGNTVIIDHENGFSTLYAHQSSILVRKGDKVVAGQAIGKVGSTGWSTGNHLHFEIRYNNEHKNPLDYY
jgi:murein DD-endopeptidase MepM/ murein hydrolase activator NlpD